MFGEVGVGEVVIGGHVRGDDQGEDVEGAGDVEQELDIRARGKAAAQAVAFLGGVTLELDVDDRGERLTGGAVRKNGDVGGDGAARAKPPDPSGDRGGRASDLLGELVGGLEIVLLEGREQLAVERVQCLPHGAAYVPFVPETGKPGPLFAAIRRSTQGIKAAGNGELRPMMRQSVLLAAAFCLAAPALAQPGSRPATAAGAASVNAQQVVSEVRRVIAERYVLPERRPALDAVLAEGLSSGRYATSDANLLAERINEDLTRVGRDRHLNFRYDPGAAAMFTAEGGREPDPGAYERQAQRRNYGIRELRVLPGNVRYMAYDGFDWTGESSAAALETAMRFLSGGDAVIIDLRRNGGGSPAAVQYITSHFMAANQPLMTFHMNGSETPDRTATLTDVPAGRMIGKPLYVLTSNASASAAEEFAGHVAGYRLGQLVGETTAGAGFRNDLVPIAGNFILSVSVGRAVLASTGRDWEAVGHAPNIVAPVPAALDVAHAAALRQLAENATGADRDRMLALADTMAARGERRSPALPLASYAGAFGERAIVVDGDRLYYQRGQRPREPLIALGANRFAMENNPMLQVEFAADGSRATAFTIRPVGDPPQGTYQRTQ